MYSELRFVPKLLLCGDAADFFSRVGNRPFKLIGKLQIVGEVGGQQFHLGQDGRLFFDGKLQDLAALRKFLAEGAVDYVIFTDLRHYSIIRNYCLRQGLVLTKIITLELFKTLPIEFFYDFTAERQILAQLKNLSVKTLLDVDGYFARGQIFTHDDGTEIDCVTDKPLPPIMENFYAHAYKNLAEVGFKRYDAALIIERTPQDFNATFALLEDFSDLVITFARAGSELAKYLVAAVNKFGSVRVLRTEVGTWFLVQRRAKPQDFCMYVVTHKPTPHADKLPADYKLIHAGRAQA